MSIDMAISFRLAMSGRAAFLELALPGTERQDDDLGSKMFVLWQATGPIRLGF
ncbi:MAG: hypothetical protein ACR2PI_13555 [Hyphomicrobiaceae bacterium]